MKISIKLDILAKKLGKNITDIAKETGLNRNTINSLFHNKVDGIKFDTIEKICSTYNVSLSEIIDAKNTESPKKVPLESITIKDPYRQEGAGILFTVMPPFESVKNVPKEYMPSIKDFPGLITYVLKDYGYFYWPRDAMNRLAKEFYEGYSTKKKVDKVYNDFTPHALAIENLYRDYSKEEIISFSNQEIIDFSKNIWEAYEGFWNHSLFIDFFDPGFDVEKISEIQKKYGFTDSEVVALTTTAQMTFGNERLLRLCKIIKKIVGKKISKKEDILKFVKSSTDVAEYIVDFDYVKSNYAHIEHFTHESIVTEILDFLKDDHWKSEYEKLSNYSNGVKKEVSDILKRYSLTENPLYFFQLLTYWREYRKQINLMGIHLMHYILYSIEQKTAIPYKYLKHLTFDEVPNVLKGLISKDQLSRRYEDGAMLSSVGGQTKLIEGKEAKSIRDEMDLRINGNDKETIISGRVACQGYAKGIARIILNQADFSKFNDGEIIVTGMTRPEFVPLMKKALAIVTNEGGITCHAAIISRELGKPCIIGTQKATSIIKDGDLIEVRANHGTVRVLKK